MAKIKLSLLKQVTLLMVDKSKLMDCMLYAALILILGSSLAAILYMVSAAIITHTDIKVAVFQLIAQVSLVIAQVVGLAALIFWTTTKTNKKHIKVS